MLIPKYSLSRTMPIPGYQGLYRIDKEGNVWNTRTEKRLAYHYHYGYRRVTLRQWDTYRWRNRMVARLLAEAWLPPEPETESARVGYRDGNRANIELSNLYWNFTYENMYKNADPNTYTVINKLKDKVTGTRKEICEKTGLTRQALSLMINKKQIQSKGWFICSTQKSST